MGNTALIVGGAAVVGITAVVLLSQSTKAAPAGTSSLSGTVADAVTGQPLSGATLTLGQLTVTSDAQGDFTFDGIAPGNYTLEVSLSGYQGGSMSVTVNAGQNTIAVTLTALTGTLLVTVTDQSGVPITTATVTLGGVTVTSNTNGVYELDDIPVGTYEGSVSAPGYETSNF